MAKGPAGETWHDEYERLTKLLEAIASGEVTHIDEDDKRQLQATNSDNVAKLRARLAALNARLGRN